MTIQANRPPSKPRRIDRRTFLTGSATTAGALLAGVPASTRPARAALPLVPIGIGLATGAVAGYLVRELQERYTGDDFDEEAWEEASDDLLHAEIYDRAGSMGPADDTVLTLLNNHLEDATNTAWGTGKAAAVEQLELGNSQSGAMAAAEENIDDYYATMQMNLLNHYHEQVLKLKGMFSRIASSGLSLTIEDQEVILALDEDGSRILDRTSHRDVWTTQQHTTTLVDGPSEDYLTIHIEAYNGSKSAEIYIDEDPRPYGQSDDFDEIRSLAVRHPEIGSDEVIFHYYRFVEAWKAIEEQHALMVNNIQVYVTELFDEYDPGDLDYSEILDPVTLASEFATKYEETGALAYAGADLALLGVPSSIGKTLVVKLHDTGATVEAQLFALSQPDGGFEVGEPYHPDDVAGPVYLAIDTSTMVDEEKTEDDEKVRSGIFEVQEIFTIQDAESVDGDSLDIVELEQRNHHTAEVHNTEEEIESIVELRDELETTQEQIAQGSGGSILEGDWPSVDPAIAVSVVAVGGGVLAVLGLLNQE